MLALSMIFLPYLVALSLLLWVFHRFSQAKRMQDRLVRSVALQPGDVLFRVAVTRPDAFASWLKLVGFEARGVLIGSADRVRVLAQLRSGERIDRVFFKQRLSLRWIGNPSLASTNMHWIALGEPGEPLIISADTGPNALQSREATADLCRNIAPDFQLPESAASEFALERNPASLTVMAVILALLAFAVVDGGVLNKNELLNPGDAAWPMLLIPLALVPVYWGLARARVPSRESWTLALMAVTMACAAWIPAIKRADQLLTPDATLVYYRLEPRATLKAVTGDAPPIRQPRDVEYWQQFDEGSIHHFRLYHGPLGLWQLDRSELNVRMRTFYEGRREQP